MQSAKIVVFSVFLSVILAACVGAAPAEPASDAEAEQPGSGGPKIVLSEALANAPQPNGAVYVTLKNEGGEDDALVSAKTEVADSVELHESSVDENDVARMKPIAEVLLPAGETATLGPGGKHLMLVGLKKTLAAGDTFTMTLNFEKSGAQTIEVEVQQGTAAGHSEAGHEAHSSAYPLTIENCGLSYTYEAPPEKAVTMNQAATEIMLALGLEEKMVGTAYLDDAILPEFEVAYHSIPVLAEEYPSQEVLFATDPDFVYGSYRSAFGEEAAGPREELLALDISSYVSTVSCEDEALQPDTATIETVYGEIRDIARIFAVQERGEGLIAEMQAKLDSVTETIGDEARPIKIFWYDSGDEEPFAGACCGTPNEIIRRVEAENIFADAEGSWATVSWEEVVDRDPEAIVLIEAEWSPAADKIELLTTNPAYASISAVQNERFIVLPFSATTLGIRNVEAVVALARGLYPKKFE